jgi:hypothetical protein
MAHWAASNNVRDIFHCQVDQMGGYFAPFSMQRTLHVRIYQQSAGKFLKKSDFEVERLILIASSESPTSKVSSNICLFNMTRLPLFLIPSSYIFRSLCMYLSFCLSL